MKVVNYFLLCAVFLANPMLRFSAADPYRPAPPTDHSQKWCEGDLPASSIDKVPYPDGGIVQVGPYLFRTCRQMVEPKIDGKRVMRYFYNPQRVDRLRYEKAMVGLMINGLMTWKKTKEVSLRSHRLTGRELIGDISYDVYQYFHPLTQEKSDRKKFVYSLDNNDASSGLPPHIITCSKSFDLHPEESIICHISIGYDQIWASLLFIGGGPDLTPVPFDLFPQFAADMYRVLETGDVTEEVRSGALQLPRLD